jgi:hypothetical protein
MTPTRQDSPDGYGDPSGQWPALRFPGDDSEDGDGDEGGDAEQHICRSID